MAEVDPETAGAVRRDGMPYALVTIMLWSTQAAVVVSLRGWTSPQLLFATYLIAAIVLNAWAWCRHGLRHALAGLRPLLDWRVLACALLGTFIYQMAAFTGLRLAPPAKANLLNYLWPLSTALFAVPIRHERMTGRLWASLALGLAGTFVLVGGAMDGAYPSRYIGYCGSLLAAITWGIYSNWVSRLDLDPLTAQRGFLLAGAISFGIAALVDGAAGPPLGARPLAMVAYIGCLPVAAASVLWQEAMQRGPVQRISVVAYVSPVLSTLWLGLLADVPLTRNVWLGLCLVLAAALLPSLRHLPGRSPARASR